MVNKDYHSQTACWEGEMLAGVDHGGEILLKSVVWHCIERVRYNDNGK